MKNLSLLILIMAGVCLAGKGYTVDTIRVYEDTSCLYSHVICERVTSADSTISPKMIPLGTLTIRWGPYSAIGQDYLIAHNIAIKEGGKQGASVLLYISSTNYKETGNIANITYRMYGWECKP